MVWSIGVESVFGCLKFDQLDNFTASDVTVHFIADLTLQQLSVKLAIYIKIAW